MVLLISNVHSMFTTIIIQYYVNKTLKGIQTQHLWLFIDEIPSVTSCVYYRMRLKPNVNNALCQTL